MNFKLTLGLAVVLLALASLLFFLPEKKAEVTDTSGTTALFSDKSPLSGVSYSRDGQQQLALAKTGDNWTLTYPVKGKASQYSVSSVTDALSGLRYRQQFEPEQGSGTHSAEYTGTAKPRHVVEMTEADGKKHTVAFGKTAVGGIFATVDGGKTIYLLDGNPIDQLNRDPQSFRDTMIKTVEGDKITGLTIKHADQTVQLEKVGSTWEIVSPIHGRANGAVVDEVVNQMKFVNAAAFADMTKDMPATGLTPAVVSVTVEGAAPKTEPATTAPAATQSAKVPLATLDVGYYTDLTSKKNVYATMADSSDVFTLPADSLKKLDKTLTDLRDPVIVPVTLTGVTNVSIASDSKPTVTVKKNGDAWQLSEGETKVPGDASTVTQMMTAIKGLRAIKYVDNVGDLKSIGLQPAVTAIEVTVPGDATGGKAGTGTLLIGKPEKADNVTPMMWKGESGGETVYLVQSNEAEKIAAFNALALRSKEIERLMADDVRGITIEGKEVAGGKVVLTRDGSTWNVMENGKSVKADPSKVTELLAEFSPLTAANFVEEGSAITGHADVSVTVTGLDFGDEKAATTGPATAPAAMGPKQAKPMTRTLRMYKLGNIWRAIWDGGGEPTWTFAPPMSLISHVTTGGYAAPTPASQPATAPAAEAVPQ